MRKVNGLHLSTKAVIFRFQSSEHHYKLCMVRRIFLLSHTGVNGGLMWKTDGNSHQRESFKRVVTQMSNFDVFNYLFHQLGVYLLLLDSLKQR